ncbi:putative cysteine-rich receptor-like protein kinase 9 [Silene latifolia]|uniref:putative cysteine-rich receptor-like protein kinase 9 n=1 Tax=Silene latifolia TaxID=37657 RepID=UPI003D778FC7
MVRYSNNSFFGIWDQDAAGLWLINTQNVTGNVTRFNNITHDMMINIVSQAARGGSDIKYETGSVGYSSLVTVYGSAQCTPDLSSYDCMQCLVDAIVTLPTAIGARFLQPNCNARYETYQFFNGNTTLTGTVSPSPPPTSNATGTVILSHSSTPGPNSGMLTKLYVIIA